MTQDDKAKAFVDRVMHNAHLRYQRQMMRPDTTHGQLPTSEVRGVHEQRRKPVEFQMHWMTGLRPNFWKAYFETLMFMSK